LNLRPLGYEPSELPSCSTPRRCVFSLEDPSHATKSVPGVPPIGASPCRGRYSRRTVPAMSRIVVRPFEAADLPAAGRLLAERHARHRRTQPLLPAAYEDAKLALVEVTAVWESEGASGSVAVDDKDYATFVAEYDGKVIGAAIGCSLEKSSAHSGLSRPDNAGFLGFAAVLPESRGHGAGRALGETVLQVVRRHRLRLRGHGLAGHEPPVVTGLAEARLRADIPSSAPPDRLLDGASAAKSADSDARVLGRRTSKQAVVPETVRQGCSQSGSKRADATSADHCLHDRPPHSGYPALLAHPLVDEPERDVLDASASRVGKSSAPAGRASYRIPGPEPSTPQAVCPAPALL
jgi:GNAT superfamily N-acetyltransferase